MSTKIDDCRSLSQEDVFPQSLALQEDLEVGLRLALYFLINSKLAFSLHVSQRCLAGTQKKKKKKRKRLT